MATKAAVRAKTNPNALFRALDGRKLAVGGGRWCIEVYSVRDGGNARWVQLALVGQPYHVVAMRLASGDGPRSAIRKLSSWLMSPSMFSEAPAASRTLNAGICGLQAGGR